MRTRNFWIITLTAALACTLTLRLGFWQLARAEQKKVLQTRLLTTQSHAVWDNDRLLERYRTSSPKQLSHQKADAVANLASGLPTLDWLYQPVQLTGRWLPEHTVYLENRPMLGRIGFWVYTPLQLRGSDAVILIQRGWVQRNFQDMKQLPIINTASGWVSVRGRLLGAPSKLFEWQHLFDSSPSKIQAVRLNLDLSDYLSETKLRTLLPFITQQTIDSGHEGDGMERNWAEPDFGLAKHHGYAFQWFAFTAIIVVLYLWFQWWLPWRRRFG